MSALAPENLAKPRPKAAVRPDRQLVHRQQPGHSGLAVRAGDDSQADAGGAEAPRRLREGDCKEGKVYRDDIGQCWPAGVPIIMTRVWPIAMIQMPTAIYMVSEFMNSLRVVFLDGRPHTDPDIVVRTFNGESVGRWEGDTLVVETKNFIDDEHHWVDQGVPGERRAAASSSASA